jgi:hypothetical protein
MRVLPLLGAVFIWSACGSSSSLIADSGYTPDSGSPDAGLSGLGGVCNPSGSPSCPEALICDSQTDVCRLPRYGDACDPSVGCATEPMGMMCTETTYEGSPVYACLIACSAQDSSKCPYGSSCGDPNLPGYCSGAGSTSCTPGQPCALGPDVQGVCVSTSGYNTCLATGVVRSRYGSCNPNATNNQSNTLCGSGSTPDGGVFVCEGSSGGLGMDPNAGFCFPICQSQSDCLASEHCSEGSTFRLGVCRPGIACSIDQPSCPWETVCVPDSVNSLSGGCLALSSSPGALGQACQPPATPVDPVPCSSGACLPVDGGNICSDLCNLDGGKPTCPADLSCQSLQMAPATATIGVCQ